MAEIKCPSCGSPNVEQIDTDKYECPYCGTTFKVGTNSQLSAPVNSKQDLETTEDRSNGIYSILGWLFYAIAAIDFCGMFFDYDLTGFSWSPLVFCGIGYIFESLAKKK